MGSLRDDLLARLGASPGVWQLPSDVRGEADFNTVQAELAALAAEGVIQGHKRSPGVREYRVGELPPTAHFSEGLPQPWTWSAQKYPGCIPGWYGPAMPAGSRWFAGVKWNVAQGRRTLDPQEVEGDVSAMPWPRLFFECLDMTEGQRDSWGPLARQLVGVTADTEPANRLEINLIVESARGRYAQFVAPWTIAEFLATAHYTIPQRLGWGFSSDQLRAMQNARLGFIAE